ncbi:hypothetical protein D9615_003062 [Tricholomella constricta]|uniref:Uncharacterized protein n=1 Tax=Tricholomella constricta TaxID=117010 RepID=A0A8H5M6D4_9AGAR|nr:hypothetical protein D9615_003062 [Tricholomella constricta]
MSSRKGWSCIDGLDASATVENVARNKKHLKGSSTKTGVKYTMDVTFTNTPNKAARTRLITTTTSTVTAPPLTDTSTQVPGSGTRLTSSTISKSMPTSIEQLVAQS